MAVPIDQTTAEAIQSLRGRGLTQKEIVKLLNISRSTVVRYLNPAAKEANAEAARRRRYRAQQAVDLVEDQPF
jgi:predicted transcriptional regulator